MKRARFYKGDIVEILNDGKIDVNTPVKVGEKYRVVYDCGWEHRGKHGLMWHMALEYPSPPYYDLYLQEANIKLHSRSIKNHIKNWIYESRFTANRTTDRQT